MLITMHLLCQTCTVMPGSVCKRSLPEVIITESAGEVRKSYDLLSKLDLIKV
jgi:hypothetical protein